MRIKRNYIVGAERAQGLAFRGSLARNDADRADRSEENAEFFSTLRERAFFISLPTKVTK